MFRKQELRYNIPKAGSLGIWTDFEISEAMFHVKGFDLQSTRKHKRLFPENSFGTYNIFLVLL